jgi:hypothetical protein
MAPKIYICFIVEYLKLFRQQMTFFFVQAKVVLIKEPAFLCKEKDVSNQNETNSALAREQNIVFKI